jgi:hypothetical protein
VQEFQVLRILEPALRMKAQADSNSRGQKDFICREEKRKTTCWRTQGDPETGDPVGQGGEWGFIAYLHCLRAEMSLRCRQAFPREERCLLDSYHLLGPPAVRFSVLHSPLSMVTRTAVRDRDNEVYSVTASC